MSTNKLVLRTPEEVMADFQPTYIPFWPLLLSNGKAKAYPQVVGQHTFKRLEAVGDLRNKIILPKDSHVHQITASETSKTFKKYFLASQFVQSMLQDREQNEQVVAQVLDENNKLADDLVLLGGGSSAETVENNGLYWSADPNYLLEGSTQLASTGDHLPALHASVVAEKLKADTQAGRKVIVFYGSTMLTKLSSIYATSSVPFRDALQKAIGANYSIAELPEDVTPATSYGFMIINLDQIRLNYVVGAPYLESQGVDERNREVWHNFLNGSFMVDVTAYKGIIRQPHTFA